MIEACPDHAAIAARALAEDATDAELLSYAESVPSCAACSRLLAVGAGVHPQHLAQANPDEEQAIATRMALDTAAVHRLETALDPPRWRTPALLTALAAAAALAIWLAAPAQISVSPTTTGTVGEVVSEATHPDRQEAKNQDAVAMMEVEPEQHADWEMPPFEELRGPAGKGVARRELSFKLDGDAAVGEATRLVVDSASAEAVTLCVDGPERGVLWRGGVPTGQVVLTRDGRALRYRFPAEGTYRFALALGDSPTCRDPVHVVEIAL